MKRILIATGLAVWLLGICTAFVLVWRYKMSPGAAALAPPSWPTASALHRDLDRANIVFVAHPQCPCTTASMAELVRLADELHGHAKIHVVMVRPKGAEPGFEDGAIRDRAATILGADVFVDVDGAEAQRFGASVSGSTIVYGRDGRLAFSGGLTVARGHEGRGPAHDRILAAIDLTADHRSGIASSPTYGCELAERTP